MSADSTTRRVAGIFDQVTIAALGASLLAAWLQLPQALSRLELPSVPQFVTHLGSPASGLPFLTWGGAFLVLFGTQFFLARLGHRRFRLTRPLAGAMVAIVGVNCAAALALSAGLDARGVPLALAALWVVQSFGQAAGLIAGLGALALSVTWLAGNEDLAVLTVRCLLFVLLAPRKRGAGKLLSVGGLCGLLAGLTALAVQPGALLSLTGGSAQATTQLAWAALFGASDAALFVLLASPGQRLLGQVSRERLVALLDLSQPLLQRMVTRAPGSFEHSRAMANLAEQAASAVGADALLTRVGAYYHDLGKSIDPKYFVENLEADEPSPHLQLTPQESAAKIVRHVSQGAALLREGGIPEAIVEFSYTHHGTSRVEYFLNKQKKLQPSEPVDEAMFRYPGMKPSTRETAILMVVDSIEAASRTVDTPDRDRLQEMVQRIVFSKLAAQQLDDCGLTMKELRIVCARVVETLVHMNHHRIKYPWQEEQARQFGLNRQELSSPPPEVTEKPSGDQVSLVGGDNQSSSLSN